MKEPVPVQTKIPELSEFLRISHTIPKVIERSNTHFVISAEKCLVLQSYETLVAVVLRDGSYVQDENQPQSKTTARQLKAFVEKYARTKSPNYRINLNGVKS